MNKNHITKLIHDIAEMVDCGHVCFLNPENVEHIDNSQGVLEGGDNREFIWQF